MEEKYFSISYGWKEEQGECGGVVLPGGLSLVGGLSLPGGRNSVFRGLHAHGNLLSAQTGGGHSLHSELGRQND